MQIYELIILALALAMDAFSASVCQGMANQKNIFRLAIVLALSFGFFQGFMPLLGYLLGTTFAGFISSIDHWIAFGLLGFIGFNMIKEAKESEQGCNDISLKQILILSIATSIDAFAAGIPLALLNINIIFAISAIGIITFICCFLGVYLGKAFNKLPINMNIVGGIVLILLGFKILLDHLGIL